MSNFNNYLINNIGENSTMGFGNRIFSLIGDIRLANDFYHANYKLFWDTTEKKHIVRQNNKTYIWKCIRYPFEQLFDINSINTNTNTNIHTNIYIINKNEFNHSLSNDTTNHIYIKKKTISNQKPYVTKFIKQPHGIVNGFPILEHEIPIIKNITSYQPEFNKTLSFTFDKLPQYFRDIYLQYFNILKPSNEITNIINHFTNKYFNNNMIGIHIRRGDFLVYNPEKYDRNSHTNEKFFNEIDKLIQKNNKIKIFLTSDDKETEKLFINKYNINKNIQNNDSDSDNDTIITFPNDNDVRDEKTALIIILLLAKCKTLILSKLSSFSELAWWFGGCSANVIYIS